MKMDEMYKRINDDVEFIHVDKPKESSQIQRFFTDKIIFITGSTGFIGKCLVEKLLRSCPELKKIYILIRPKGNAPIQDRIDEYFRNIIFDLLRKENPRFMEKVVPLAGDLMEPGLGLSSEDRRMIIEDTDVILHNGATVIFDMQISVALKINVLGTKEMLNLATECKSLKVFVYVSTAYSHCYLEYIEEKFYDPPANLKMVQDMLRADDENKSGLSEGAIKEAFGNWPNTYTFTKATAETLVQEYSRRVSFPCCVFRPSIVISTYKEPIGSWCGNANGPQAPFLATGLGILHAMYIEDHPFAIVPADMTTNALLAVTWDVAENKKDLKEAQVYAYSSSVANPVSLRQIEKFVLETAFDAPPMKAVWYYFTVTTRFYALFWLYHILFHFLPACIADLYLTLRWKTPMALPIFFKVTKHLDKLLYFGNGKWWHDVTQMAKVWDKMNEKDTELFYCDLRILDWEDYFRTFWLGIRTYLLQDPPDTIDRAKRRYSKLKMIHYTVVTLIATSFVYYTIRLLNNISYCY